MSGQLPWRQTKLMGGFPPPSLRQHCHLTSPPPPPSNPINPRDRRLNVGIAFYFNGLMKTRGLTNVQCRLLQLFKHVRTRSSLFPQAEWRRFCDDKINEAVRFYSAKWKSSLLLRAMSRSSLVLTSCRRVQHFILFKTLPFYFVFLRI